MDMKLLEEGTAKERTGDLTLEAYASIASRQRRRESFFRAAALHCTCSVIFACAFCYAAVRRFGDGAVFTDTVLYGDPGTARIMLERFFILACVPAACFASAFTAACRAVCAACASLCGGFCGAAIFKTVRLVKDAASAQEMLIPLSCAIVFVYTAAATALFSSACVSFRVCDSRYGATAQDKDELFKYLMIMLSVMLVLCALTLLIPEITTLISL